MVNLLRLGSTNTIPAPPDVGKSVCSERHAGPATKGSSVSFSHVNFAYPARPDVQVLKDLSLQVKPGEFAALVGQSGAGKSTIIALLERMYRIGSGMIAIDGANIATAPAGYRDDVAFVPQDSMLFDGTVRFNLKLGSLSTGYVTDAEVEEARRVANIHDTIIALPQGYDTECGSNGTQFSGGQKQRLAIARALVRKPKLLLPDESTSALDPESERSLRDGQEAARKKNQMTIIAIAHRLDTIRNADFILVIEDGRVAIAGTHEELTKSSSTYRMNVKFQGF